MTLQQNYLSCDISKDTVDLFNHQRGRYQRLANEIAALDGLAARLQPGPDIVILIGLTTVAAPFLILQLGMGAGVAASRTPNPAVARTRSVIGHFLFSTYDCLRRDRENVMKTGFFGHLQPLAYISARFM
jgi:hypothetical protein